MKKTISSNEKKARIAFLVGIILTLAAFVASAVLFVIGMIGINTRAEVFEVFTMRFVRSGSAEDEGYDDDSRVCEVGYTGEDEKYTCVIKYGYDEWKELEEGHSFEGKVYLAEDGAYAVFDVSKGDADDFEISDALRECRVNYNSGKLNIALAFFLTSLGFGIMTVFGHFFNTYEKIWFVSILVLASAFAIIFPEEQCNGVNGVIIMALYLADTLLNILCELLISKQSKWNFVVSVGVELTEILICIVLAYRFATMVTTLFFWLPIDIISFINWNKHPDPQSEEITKVRKLGKVGEIIVISGIVVWTLGVGYLLTLIDIGTDLFGGNEVLEVAVCYIDACASAVGVANGVFILLRYREQWIAWYICSVLEAIINILSGQFVLLVLKLGYITNTTYGYIEWTKYIKSRSGQDRQKIEAK